jgi:hypothetical protein
LRSELFPWSRRGEELALQLVEPLTRGATRMSTMHEADPRPTKMSDTIVVMV